MSSGNNIPPLKPYTLTANRELSPGVHLISFKRDYEFQPGQVIKLAYDTSHPPRIYSICSGNTDPEVSILFNIKADGLLTPKLAASVTGDTILATAPYGSFTGNERPAWWIATGTGIAPFYSMLRSGPAKNKTLIHGVRHLDQFYFEEELKDMLGNKYIRCCSREPSADTYFGRITKYLSEMDALPDVDYYLCGKALMVVEVRDLLIEKGISFNRI